MLAVSVSRSTAPHKKLGIAIAAGLALTLLAPLPALALGIFAPSTAEYILVGMGSWVAQTAQMLRSIDASEGARAEQAGADDTAEEQD